MTGPNKRPICAVPRACTTNSATRITDARSGTTTGREPAVDDLEPLHRREHRDRRRDHAVAEEQRGADHAQQHEDAPRPRRPAPRWASAISARVPPSPLLSARMRKHDVFDGDDRAISAQNISESTPMTSSACVPRRRAVDASASASRRAGWCRCRRRRRRARPGAIPAEPAGPPAIRGTAAVKAPPWGRIWLSSLRQAPGSHKPVPAYQASSDRRFSRPRAAPDRIGRN